MKLRSHLTRQVFRTLIAEQPYRAPACQLGNARRTRCSARRQNGRSFHTAPSLQLFGFTPNTPKPLANTIPTPDNIRRALGQLVDLVRAKRLQQRPPSNATIIDTVRFIASVRADNPAEMSKLELFVITEALEHLLSQDLVLNDRADSSITKMDLQNLAAALAQYDGVGAFPSEARSLADVIFKTLRSTEEQVDPEIFGSYVTTLARSGSVDEAIQLLKGMKQLGKDEALHTWLNVLKAEQRPSAVLSHLKDMEAALGPLDASSREDLVISAATHGNLGVCKELMDTRGQGPLTTPALAQVLKLCIEKGHRSLGAHCAEVLLKRPDLGPSLDMLLLWYASESQYSRSLKQIILDFRERGMGANISMDTFNLFIKYALLHNDAEQAQRYKDLADFFGLRPNGATYILDMEYELAKDDISAALQSLDNLFREDIPKDRSDIPVLNKLLQKLTSLDDASYQTILRVVDHMLSTSGSLDSNTVAALCSVFLRMNESDHLEGLLRYRVDAFTRPDRARIMAVFKQFILQPGITDQVAWNTYDLLRNSFPEMSVADRTQLMQHFFDRGRSDFATLVFGHMRQRKERDARPTDATYAQCIYGIAKCKDVDGLRLVHNMLKMDLHVERTTKVHNALMAAYPAVRQPFSAIIDHFWKILDSREGPTLSSFLLALRACETWIPTGSLEARRIMALMQKWNMVITKEIYDTYIGAIAGQSEYENVAELIEHMEEDIGESPDAITLGTFYNAIPWQYRKDEVEKWAKRHYPELWNELESFGDWIDEDWEVRYFKINRDIDTDDELLFSPGQYTPELARESRIALGEPTNS